MKYKKYKRIKDSKIFFILTYKDGTEFLCSNSLRVLKHKSGVKDFDKRFKEVIK